jgi:hypothetical protein
MHIFKSSSFSHIIILYDRSRFYPIIQLHAVIPSFETFSVTSLCCVVLCCVVLCCVVLCCVVLCCVLGCVALCKSSCIRSVLACLFFLVQYMYSICFIKTYTIFQINLSYGYCSNLEPSHVLTDCIFCIYPSVMSLCNNHIITLILIFFRARPGESRFPG